MKTHHRHLCDFSRRSAIGVALLIGLAAGDVAARNLDPSSWTKSISGIPALEPDEVSAYEQWAEQYSNLAVNGTTVHAAWYSYRWNGSPTKRFVYRRSVNSGSSWAAPIVLASNADFPNSQIEYSESSRFLCVQGNTVHAVVVRSFSPPGQDWYFALYYHRSIDNGATFQPGRLLYTAPAVWPMTPPFIAASPQRVVIAYKAAANWYNSHSINVLVSENNGGTFRSTQVASSESKNANLEDLVVKGTDIHVLYYLLDVPYYYGSFQARTALASSIDDGRTFTTNFLTTPASDGGFYTLSTKDIYNSADLVADGNNVHAVWTQLDTDYNGTKTLMYARSTNRGVTFGAPLVLHKSSLLAQGQETIAAKGNYVYVPFITTDNKILMRRSANAGASFAPTQEISTTGGWWPQAVIDPRDTTGASVHIFHDHPTWRHSTNGGATFTNPLWAHVAFGYATSMQRSQYVAAADGSLHITSTGGYGEGGDSDIHYRTLRPQPAPTGTKSGLRLYTYFQNGQNRSDNFQALPKTLGFTKAMTAELWVKDLGDGMGTGDSLYQRPIFFKATDHGSGFNRSYGLGTIYDSRKIIANVVTTSGPQSLLADEVDAGLLPLNQWTHLAMTYNAVGGENNFKLYQNGVLIAQQTVTGDIVPGTGNLFVGRYGNWVVDDLRFWNHVRTESQINQLKNRVLSGTEAGLAAYYSFDNTARDLTGKGNDGIFMFKETYAPGFVEAKGSQIIKFPKPPGKVAMGSKPIPLIATASSMLPVSYTSSNPKIAKVLSDNTIRILGVGTVRITAKQAGNGSYYEAAPVKRKLEIVKGTQVIRFAKLKTRAYKKGEKFTLKAKLNSGLKVKFASSKSSVISIKGNVATMRGKGTAVITASQSGNKNWLAAKPVKREITLK